jgi:hypothetical protein
MTANARWQAVKQCGMNMKRKLRKNEKKNLKKIGKCRFEVSIIGIFKNCRSIRQALQGCALRAARGAKRTFAKLLPKLIL